MNRFLDVLKKWAWPFVAACWLVTGVLQCWACFLHADADQSWARVRAAWGFADAEVQCCLSDARFCRIEGIAWLVVMTAAAGWVMWVWVMWRREMESEGSEP